MLGLVIASASILGVLPATGRVAFANEPAAPPFCWTQMERHPENPILRARPDTWESQWFIVDTVFQVDGRWWMYYDGAGPQDKKSTALGLAFSDDGIHWERGKDNPIWTKAGNWSNFLRDVRVHRFEGEPGFWMYYAWSTDGIAWQKSPDNPVFRPSGKKGAWDAGKVSMHVLAETGDETFNIYYSGGVSPEATYAGIGLIRARLTRTK